MPLRSHISSLNTRILYAGIFVFFFALYLWSHIFNFFNRDPLYYSLQVETYSWAALFSDYHHLLYRPVGRLWFLIWQSLGYKDGAMFPLQALSGLVGAATVVVFFGICLRLTHSRRFALLAAAFAGFSYGLWRYSAEAYPHMFLLFFTSTAALVLLRGVQEQAASTSEGPRRYSQIYAFALAGAFTALGALFYQTAVLFLFPALWLILRSQRIARRRRVSAGLAFLLPCLLLLAGPYLWAAGRQPSGMAGIFHYKFGSSGWMSYGRFSPTSLLKAPIGAGNLFIGESFASQHFTSFQKVRGFLASHTGIPLFPRDGPPLSLGAALLLYLLFGLACIALVWLCVLVFIHWRKIGRQFPFGRALSAAWLVPFAALPIWWFPENRQFWLSALLPMCLLLSLAAQAGGRLRLLGVCVGLLAITNLFGSILPDRQPENNPLLQRTYAVADTVTSQDLVVTISAGELKHLSCYLEYYLRCHSVDLLALFYNPEGTSAGRRLIRGEIVRAWSEGGRVFLVSEGLGSGLVYQQVARYKSVTPEQVKAMLSEFLSEYEREPVVLFREQPLLYLVKPGGSDGWSFD